MATDGVTGLSVAPGALVRVSGAVTTSTDGSVFDAVSSWTPSGTGPMPGGPFDLAAGGLRIVEAHPSGHTYVLAVDDAFGPACTAAGVASPCLVSRLAALSHARLKTVDEFAATLSGSVSVADQSGPPPRRATGWVGVALAVAVVAVLALAVQAARRRARTPLGRVRAEARRALRATRSDATLGGVRTQIAAIVARAVDLDAARRACARKLVAFRRSPGDAPEGGPWIGAERAEATRLERVRAASLAGLERIEAALRWVTLRTLARRAGRDDAVAEAAVDPVASLATELALRDEAIAEANTALTEALIAGDYSIFFAASMPRSVS